ncbi:MAG TPA: type II toxin-antitoxin system VapC family toxin [Allosphingosinicella sp.]|nr:type II toxin-antitoxin system VapC family toxin [Allosphingosinicella sp.]
MKYLFDSNIIIMTVMAMNPALQRRLADCDEGDIVTSAIAYAEVAHGAVRGRPPSFEKLQAFIEEAPVLDFDLKAAQVYATLSFKRASYDRLIAAHTLSHGLTLVTDNEADFDDIPHLKVENWTKP